MTELFGFLSKAFCKEDKEVIITDGKWMLNTQLLQDVHSPAPCSHAEPDSRILHVSHDAQHGHNHMFIPTPHVNCG